MRTRWIAALIAALAALVLAAPASAQATWWQPTATGPNHGPEVQWYLNGPIDLNNPAEMGTTTADETGAGGVHTTAPTVYDIDGIENSEATVGTLNAAGDETICYIEVGSAGNYYPASEEGIPTTYYAQLAAAGDLGAKLSGYPEKFINITAPSAVTILENMISQQCAAKGFKGIEPDLDETFGNNEGKTGFGTFTEAQEVSFLSTLAAYAHNLGLAWGSKNPDDTGDQQFVDDVQPFSDFVITEECEKYQTCSLLTPFTAAGKLVINAEYTADYRGTVQQILARFCPADEAAGIDGTLFTVDLAGQRNPCQ